MGCYYGLLVALRIYSLKALLHFTQQGFHIGNAVRAGVPAVWLN